MTTAVVTDRLVSEAKILDAMGRCDLAIAVIRSQILIYPENLYLLKYLASLLRKQGDLSAAVDAIKKVIHLSPHDAAAFSDLGVLESALGDHEAALIAHHKAVSLGPQCAEYHFRIANALAKSNLLQRAISHHELCLKIDSQHARSWNNLANIFVKLGRLASAKRAYQNAIDSDGFLAVAHNGMGHVLLQTSDFERAAESFRRAVSIEPRFAQACYNLGLAYENLEALELAKICYEKAIIADENFYKAFNAIGVLSHREQQLSKAIAFYKRAVQIKPDYSVGHNNLGAAQRDTNDLKGAVASFKAAIKINPRFSGALRNLSSSHEFYPNDEFLDNLQSLWVENTLPATERCELGYALYNSLKKLGEFESAYEFLSAASQIRNRELGYDINSDAALFESLAKNAETWMSAQSKILPTSRLRPIFIIGLPRSGTSLAEQIISSHSGIEGGGELPFAAAAYNEVIVEKISTQQKAEVLRGRYLAKIRNRFSAETLFTDKMPSNFRFVVMLSAAFPEAKFVHVLRDPVANCWSLYENFFDTSGHGYSYCFDNLNQYYGIYRETMGIYAQLLGDRLFTLDYEALTREPEVVINSLFRYLEIPTEPAVFSPHLNQRAVVTASNEQIRVPIYRGSADSWKKFKTQIGGNLDGVKRFQSQDAGQAV